MGLEIDIAIVFGAFAFCLVAGMPIPFAIAAPGLLYLWLDGGFRAFNAIGLISWGSVNSFTLTAVPMFILMAQIVMHSGLSSRVYRGMARLLARVPGGLLQVNIAGCAMMAATTGSSVATAASIGSVALPQLMERDYDPQLSAGSLAAGGTLGILIPPSMAMIIYGSFTETSVAQLFMAGVIPGLLLTALFMAYIAAHTLAFPARAAPRRTEQLIRLTTALADVLPFTLLIAGTMGSMYLGLVTPTEAGAMGCVLALTIAVIWGDLTWHRLFLAVRGAVETLGNVLFIVYAAFIFSYAISRAGIGEELTAWVVDLGLSKAQFFVAVFLLYLVLGCLVETLGMIVITVPLLFPVVSAFGVDPVWFGIVLVLFVELGQITPPIGINLFVIQSLWSGKMRDVILGALPFQLILVLMLLMLVAWPQIALWLPQQMLLRH